MSEKRDETELLAIVNGAAGGGRCRAKVDVFLDRLRREGVAVRAELTEAPGHATEIARRAYGEGQRRFLSVGGDGTSYEIINGLFPEAAPATDEAPNVTLAMLPLGTGNSFLRDFGITDEEAAFRAILRGQTRDVDVVRVKHREGRLHYINTLGLGFVPRVGALTNERFKALGNAGYVAAVVACTAKLEFSRIAYRAAMEAEGVEDAPLETRESTFISFSNSRFTGGPMMMAPRASVTDGRLDIVRANRLTRRQLITTFPRIYTGTFVEHPAVEQARAAAVRFEDAGLMDVLIDGEQLKLELEALDVLPNAVRVIS